MTPVAATPRPVEAFWRTLFRWEAGKIVPPVAVRNTVGFVLAFTIGMIVDGTNAGVLASLGALNVSYSDSLDPYGVRGRRMMLASFLCGIAVTAGALSGHTDTAAVTAAAIGAFAGGMLIALGTRAGDLGVVILVTLIVFSVRPLPPSQALQSGLAALGGGLLQTLLSIGLWPVQPYEPERRIIADLYSAIANIADEHRSRSSAPPVTKQISDAQEALAMLARDHTPEAERHVFLLNQAERIRLSLINLKHFERKIASEPDGEEAAEVLAGVLRAASLAITDIGKCALHATPVRSVAAFEIEAAAFRKLKCSDSEWRSDAMHELDALAGQIRAAAQVSSGIEGPTLPAAAPDPWYLRFNGRLAKLRANLSFDSTVFRHALRLAVCLAVGDAFGRAMSLQRTYWIPMTIVIVLKPDFTSTFSRGILRIAGTFAGLLIATALFHFLHTGVATDIALMTVFMFLLRWIGPANYGLFVVALSAMVVLLIATTGVNPYEVIAARAENTAIGGVLALLAYGTWPTWEKTQVGPALAQMIDSYREYFEAVVGAYTGSGLADLNRTRLASRLARSNAEASVDRIASEPRTTQDHLAALGAIMANSHSLVHSIIAMESGLYHTTPVPVRTATREFAIEVQDALRTISSWLRGNGAVAPSVIPNLRKTQLSIMAAAHVPGERYTLIDRETDRIANSTNSLAINARRWRELTVPGAKPL